MPVSISTVAKLFSVPPVHVESDGARMKVKSVRVLLTERDPRKVVPDEQDELYTMIGAGTANFYYEKRLGHWWDTRTKDRHLSALSMTKELVKIVEGDAKLYFTVLLELRWADNEDSIDFELAAVRGRSVYPDPTSTMGALPFAHSTQEMMVEAVLGPAQVRNLLNGGVLPARVKSRPSAKAKSKSKSKTYKTKRPTRPTSKSKTRNTTRTSLKSQTQAWFKARAKSAAKHGWSGVKRVTRYTAARVTSQLKKHVTRSRVKRVAKKVGAGAMWVGKKAGHAAYRAAAYAARKAASQVRKRATRSNMVCLKNGVCYAVKRISSKVRRFTRHSKQ